MDHVKNINLRNVNARGLVLIGVAQGQRVEVDAPASSQHAVVETGQFSDWREAVEFVARLRQKVRGGGVLVLRWPLSANGHFAFTNMALRSADMAIRCTSDGVLHVDKYREGSERQAAFRLFGETA